jgi:hypothetical protein
LILALINIISRSASIMQLLSLLVAFISLSHIALAACGQTTCPPGGPYCSIPHRFSQFGKPTCILGYVLDLDKKYMDLHLYNHNCLEMWNGSLLQMGKKFDLKAPM